MTGWLDEVDAVEEFTEIYDAEVPRVDLVGKAANGVPGFLLMKAAQPTTMTRSTTMAKAGKPPIAVYDETGKLVGLVDPDDLSPIGSAKSPDPALAPQPAAAPGAPAVTPSVGADPAVAKAGARYDVKIAKMTAEDQAEWNRAVVGQLGVIRPYFGSNLDQAINVSKAIAADLIDRRVPASSAAADLTDACTAFIRRAAAPRTRSRRR